MKKEIILSCLACAILLIVPLVIASEEQHTEQLDIKHKPRINKPEPKETIEETITVPKKTSTGKSYWSRKEKDGSTTYITKNTAIQHNNLVFNWEKGTQGVWIVTHNNKEFLVNIQVGRGINIKPQ